jgi:type II secretory pathway pseudopilin PulG
MSNICQSERRANTEDGFVLIAVLFLVALILIGLAVAMPKIAVSIQRDKELELIHRGEQYRRAIKLYYKKFGAYPSTIDQLMNTNQVRFLRKRYTDPMTGKDDWKIIYLGQAKVPPLGLFGQPIANGGLPGGASALGAGALGAPVAGSSTGGGFGGSTGTSTSSFGSSSGSSAFGSGTSSASGFGSGSGTTASGTTDPSSSGFGSSTGTTTGTGSGFGSSGSTGSTLGGGPIVGVKIPDTKASIKEYKKQKHYNEWEFVYNPIEDQLQAMGALAGGQQNLNGSNTSGFGSGAPSTFNNGLGGSQPTGTTPTAPTTPQQ